jgi:hypothetical protein
MYADNPTRFRTAYTQHLGLYRGPSRRRPRPSATGEGRR